MTLSEWIAYELLGLPRPKQHSYEVNACAEEKGDIKLLRDKNQRFQQLIIKLDEELKQKKETTFYSATKKVTHTWKNPKDKNVQIPVQNFIQPGLVELAEIARKKKLYLLDGKDYDKTVAKAYKAALILDYSLDSSQFSMTERWLTAQEAIALGKGDCEDSAHVIVSMLEHIGVKKCCVYVVWGLANNGIGHSTVIVKDSTGVWRHINSSNIFESKTDLKDYPEFNKNDKSFRTNGFNLKIIDSGYNSLVSFNNFDYPKNLDSYLVKKPSPTQAYEQETYFRARVVQASNGITSIIKPIVKIDGRVFLGNAAGKIEINIPPTMQNKLLLVEITKVGYKTWSQEITFEQGKDKSRLVKLIKGAD